MLGPARFSHIEICTREVCQTFKTIEEVESCIGSLMEMDGNLVKLRKELAELSDASNTNTPSTENDPPTKPPAPATKRPDYSTLLDPVPDLTKARRLLVARQNAVESVKRMIAAAQENARVK